MNLRSIIVGLYLLLFVGVGLASAGFFLQTRAEYNRLKQLQVESERRLAEAEARLREQERILQRLRSEPEYVEKVIRRKLLLAKPDEFIFRFED